MKQNAIYETAYKNSTQYMQENTIHEAMHNICREIQYMEETTLHELIHKT